MFLTKCIGSANVFVFLVITLVLAGCGSHSFPQNLSMLPTVFEEKADNYFKLMSLCNEMLNRHSYLDVHFTAKSHCPTMYHKATIELTIQHP